MKRVIETKFYMYDQNNSGGYFMYNKVDGIAPYVFIEAASAKEANSKARDLFDDYSSYCECCGQRWYCGNDDKDGKDEPMVYGEPVLAAVGEDKMFSRNAAIHYMDGRIEWIGKDPEGRRG